VWRYEWDAENRLTKVKKTNADGSDGVMVEYGYFDNGNRAWKRVTEAGKDPVTTNYVHDGIHVIAEYNGEGELLKEYVYSDNIDEVINIKDVSKTYYPHQDGLNSVVAVTDADGERVASYNYEAFGTIKDATGALGNPITYTGRWIEPETGDYFYRARYYDSGVGRFLKRDPIGFKSNDYNFYRYTKNRVVNHNDPGGLEMVTAKVVAYNQWGDKQVPYLLVTVFQMKENSSNNIGNEHGYTSGGRSFYGRVRTGIYGNSISLKKGCRYFFQPEWSPDYMMPASRNHHTMTANANTTIIFLVKLGWRFFKKFPKFYSNDDLQIPPVE
jgi:RHS repeat-associated protein